MILYKGVRFTQQISSLVLNLWCKDLVPQKRGKGNAVSVSSVSAAGLSLYAEQRVDFVQEIVDYQMILHKGVRFPQQISSLVLNLWCKDLVPQKRGKGNAVSVSSVSATGLSLYTEQRVDFEQEISDKELTHKGVRLSPTKLFLSLKSVMQRLGSAKKRRRKCSECVRCFGHWTVFIRWTESGLCTGDWEDMNDKRRSVFYRKIIFCTTGSFSGCLSLRC